MSVVTCIYPGCENLPCPFPDKPHKTGPPSKGGCLCLAAFYLMSAFQDEDDAEQEEKEKP